MKLLNVFAIVSLLSLGAFAQEDNSKKQKEEPSKIEQKADKTANKIVDKAADKAVEKADEVVDKVLGKLLDF